MKGLGMDASLALERVRALSATSAFNRWLNLEVVSAAAGTAEIRLPWRDDLGQYTGSLHAGLIAALLDTACGFAAVTLGRLVTATQFSVECFAPGVGIAFRARGTVLKPGRRQIFTRAELFAESADAAPKLIAAGSTIMLPIDAEPVA